MTAEILRFARGKILTQTVGERFGSVHLFDETLVMEIG
jgi:hypothetical protein